ncbi:hypothetical protein GCM10027598_54940 [Amycolatopsis oliviviridis]|uniref:Uncharacterized protein n=1 Tax=Amycolatopsis oliviviridis TaxID=1471590 RepID=A0ABQ3M7T3_9PSEU|nr:hypothetical protein GCM10017790_75930 [Amycolatopsis oliviviridis]
MVAKIVRLTVTGVKASEASRQAIASAWTLSSSVSGQAIAGSLLPLATSISALTAAHNPWALFGCGTTIRPYLPNPEAAS